MFHVVAIFYLLILYPNNISGPLDKMKLDRIDFAILARLQENARVANKDLAAMVGVAPSTCLERVRRLVRSGAIRGYRTDVAPEAMGIGVQAMIAVRLVQHARVSFDQLEAELLAMTEVLSVYLLTGAQDLLIHVAVRDVGHLRDVLQSLTARGDVAHVETSLVFEFARAKTLPNYRLNATERGGEEW